MPLSKFNYEVIVGQHKFNKSTIFDALREIINQPTALVEGGLAEVWQVYTFDKTTERTRVLIINLDGIGIEE